MNNEKLAVLLTEAALLLNDDYVLTEALFKKDENLQDRLMEYLKQYNYKGDNKSGSITVNGKRIKVDIDMNSSTAKTSDGQVIPRQTAMDASSRDPRIIIGKEFTRLKNDKRRDALLYHEIGHYKYHNPGTSVTKKSRETIIDNMAKDASIQNTGTDIFKDIIKHQIKNNFKDKSRKSCDYKDTIRNSNLDKLSKYDNGKLHANATEFEADAYAYQQPNGKHLKKALKDAYRNSLSKKGFADTINATKEVLKANNLDTSMLDDKKNVRMIKRNTKVMAKNDYRQRSKALKDKTIDRSVYNEKNRYESIKKKSSNESIELLLNEAIELLDM